ncbi:hypothetical protein QOZ80_1AG0032810 [Eleusine coracana subsp. coracana]|nr:hypothetical protein QOZ80_1AG0032810 [Eleusine coracana subsp. coracana]
MSGPDWILERERRQAQQILELDMEELQVEEVDDADSSSSSDVDTFLRNTHGAGGISTPEDLVIDTSLASLKAHSYLEAMVNDFRGKYAFMNRDTILNLPMFCLQGVVLFPEAALSLRVIQTRLLEAIDKAVSHVDAPCMIGVVHVYQHTNDSHHTIASVGTMAKIRDIQLLDDGSSCVLTYGQQRFLLRRRWLDADGIPWGEVQIIEEDTPLRTPRDAFAQVRKKDTAQQRHCCGAYKSKMASQAPLSFWPRWVYEMYDSYSLSWRAADLWRQVIVNPSIDGYVKKPDLLSFYIGSKLPISASLRQELLETDGISFRLQREIQLLKAFNIIRCRNCLTLIARRSDMVMVSSDGPVGTYMKLRDHANEMIIVYNVTGLALRGDPSKAYSLFPGYTWTIALCSSCESNIGWMFTSDKKNLHPKSFWAIRTSQVSGDLGKFG